MAIKNIPNVPKNSGPDMRVALSEACKKNMLSLKS
jgi:hypothetical protein